MKFYEKYEYNKFFAEAQREKIQHKKFLKNIKIIILTVACLIVLGIFIKLVIDISELATPISLNCIYNESNL